MNLWEKFKFIFATKCERCDTTVKATHYLHRHTPFGVFEEFVCEMHHISAVKYEEMCRDMGAARYCPVPMGVI